ncbi:MAG: hypothetical protein M1818_005744 [Claussenomyces sp. TS43310]|nr:MAG: hypothetical protein M1818_005744 [Claussenomyces sp. TS43310]
MPFSSKASFLIALTTYAHHGFTAPIDLAWYPPAASDISNVTYVLSGTGVYDFIYNSSSNPNGVLYGSYNWCNMPHIRRQEYIQPHDDFSLVFVEVIHRHHKRTVYASNAFPIESYGWDCNDVELYYYAQSAGGPRPAHPYWQPYYSPINPFRPESGFVGTCQFPQITAGGLDDAWQHGKDLFDVYADFLSLATSDITQRSSFRVTQNTITSQVAGEIINGMLHEQSNVPVLVQPLDTDSLEPTYPCETASTLYSAEQSTASWKSHLDAAAPLFAQLDDISGIPSSNADWHVSFDHYYDNLSARQCHGKPLPCKLVHGVNSTVCVTQAMADEVYRLGNWEYSYLYRNDSRSLDAAVGSFGIWIGELSQHISDVIEGKSEATYFHNVAHDGSISRLLSILQVDAMVWPGMGAEVVFEVWAKYDWDERVDAHYMRVLWGGKVLRSSNPTLGLMDMVPLKTVLAYFDGLVGTRANMVPGKCNGSIPYHA